MANTSTIKNNSYIGLMSGTSLDGVDAVIVNFTQNQPQLIASYSHPIPPSLKEDLLTTINPEWRGSLESIGTLHQQLGELFADACTTLIEKSNINKKSIKAIGSHGQTLWHQPEGTYPFSLQLGDANLIAERTNITTIADFRNRDIAAGGQGAPLVPAFHHEFFSSTSKNRVILNIGGIANITYLPAGINEDRQVQGFDTGPGNGLIDAWIAAHKNMAYDKHGSWGKSGIIKADILAALLDDPYFSLISPKSTGKEYFNLAWLTTVIGNKVKHSNPEDIQATLTELTAISISNNIENGDELYICGGGLHNHYLIERLQQHLPNTVIASTEKLGIHPDWLEAMAFAWLAKQTIEGKYGNLPMATGAKGKRILGAIYQA
jgi:anhydro-N-acetylmuramic acid kinase